MNITIFTLFSVILLGVYCTNISMLKIAHRGFSGKYGDNNLESFQAAIDNNFDMVELDIQMCKSGEIVVYHDRYIDNHLIINLPVNKIRAHNIITLETFFEHIKPSDTKIFLDIKDDYGICPILVDMLITKFTKKELENIFISSFHRDVMNQLKCMDLSSKLGFTTYNDFTILELKHLMKGLHYICIDWTVLNKERVGYLQSNGYMVFSCTCKNELILNHMKKFDLDGIVTDILI